MTSPDPDPVPAPAPAPAAPANPADPALTPPPAAAIGPNPRRWRWLPGWQQLRSYPLAWLPHDIAAGLALSALLVPVGIAYAVASGVPAIAGLYATVFGLLAYALFGPSRLLVLGPDSSLVALVLAVVLPLSAGDPQRALALAGMVALVSGLLCVAAGLARLGFVTELLSKPIRHGYMNGIALTVLVSQAPALCGFSSGHAGVLEGLAGLYSGLAAGRLNPTALALGLGTLGLILLLRRRPAWPAVLIALVLATAATALLKLADGAGVVVLGQLPQGLPALVWPAIGLADVSPVLLGGLAVALVSFADTSVLSRSYAARTGQRVDVNQELVGLGAANLAAGLFQGLPVSASATRTPVAEAAGARSQLSGVVGAASVAALLVLAPSLLRHLPTPALAAVVMASALSLLEWRDLQRIHRMQRWEFWLSVGCTVGVAVLGALPGIALAIVAAVLEFLWDGWRPYAAVLGRVDGIKGYHDVRRYPQARQVPGLLLFRWDAPLFFANAELFRDRVLAAVAAAPQPVRWLVLGAEPITSVDVTAADMLTELDAQLQAAGTELHLAELKDPVKDKFKRFGLFELLGEARFSATLGEAVARFLAAHPVPWVDWEDRARHPTGADAATPPDAPPDPTAQSPLPER